MDGQKEGWRPHSCMGISNEYPQPMFPGEIRKKPVIYSWKMPISVYNYTYSFAKLGILMSTSSVSFYGEVRNIILELSPNNPSKQVIKHFTISISCLVFILEILHSNALHMYVTSDWIK